MTTTTLNTAHLQGLLQSSPVLLPLVNKVWQYDVNTLVVSFQIDGHAASIDIATDPMTGTVTGTVLGREPQMQKHLRNALVGKARLMVDTAERHILGTWSMAEAKSIPQTVAAWIDWLQQEGATSPSEYCPTLPLPLGHTSVYWWDKRSNFGDAVGPWLVERMTGLAPVNARNTKIPNRPLFTVGSIIGQLSRNSADIWGSGLIAPLEDARLQKLRGLTDITVHAVRGKATRKELIEKLGWSVPEVYGDPALLLPRYLAPEPGQASAGKISVVPHYVHAKYFKAVAGDDLHVVDVKQGLETVVHEIAASRICVSTSLHGVIVAQAYGVPWVWLRIHDHKLGGDQFKFDDFFSTLDAEAVASSDVSGADVAGLDFRRLANQASLPPLTISLEDLAEALPLPWTTPRSAAWAPPAVGSVPSARLREFAASQRSRLRRAARLVRHPRRGVTALGQRLRRRTPASNEVQTTPDGTERALDAMARELRKQNKLLQEIREALTTSERPNRPDSGDHR